MLSRSADMSPPAPGSSRCRMCCSLPVSQPDLPIVHAGEAEALHRPSCSVLAARADAESSTSLARNAGAGIATEGALLSKQRVPPTAVCTKLQRRGRGLELRRDLDVRCRNDVSLQSPSKADAALATLMPSARREAGNDAVEEVVAQASNPFSETPAAAFRGCSPRWAPRRH
jgi:hypothetical protein